MKIIKMCFVVISAMLILVGIFMIANGSLEAFPTPEQMEKARIGGIVLAGIGVCIESVIFISFLKENKSDE